MIAIKIHRRRVEMRDMFEKLMKKGLCFSILCLLITSGIIPAISSSNISSFNTRDVNEANIIFSVGMNGIDYLSIDSASPGDSITIYGNGFGGPSGYVVLTGLHVEATSWSDTEIIFDEGLNAADNNYIVIYAVDTDDTGEKDLKKMRLGLTLSMLNNNTYFTYDFGPRDHGQAWWFSEYDVDLGDPIGVHYKKDNAYWREFEKGIVVSSPYVNISINFEEEHTDTTTGIKSTSFTVEKGDGRIYIKEI